MDGRIRDSQGRGRTPVWDRAARAHLTACGPPLARSPPSSGDILHPLEEHRVGFGVPAVPRCGGAGAVCAPGVCRNLKSIVVQVGIVDYFKEPHSPEARKMFEEMVNKLQVKDPSPS